MTLYPIKTLTLACSALMLSACATTPAVKNIKLPQSTLTASQKSVEGSAIAFQVSSGQCLDSSFEISPRLSDGKYGAAKKLDVTMSTFKFATKGLTQTKFASSRKHLYVKTMAPGTYVITRIKCVDQQSLKNGTQYTTYTTKPERIDIFGEFDVEAGKTNYIGALEVSYRGGGPVFRLSDKSEAAKPFFAEHYADKVAPLNVKLLEKTKAMGADAELRALQQLLREMQ